MQIVFRSGSDKYREEHDYRDFYEVIVDGKTMFNVGDGEPEDSNLSRSFSDVFCLPSLLAFVIGAAQNGETFEFKCEEVDE